MDPFMSRGHGGCRMIVARNTTSLITYSPRRRLFQAPRLRTGDHGIAAKVSQLAWLSSRSVLSGVLSPARRAMPRPSRSGTSLITAAVYLPRLASLSPFTRGCVRGHPRHRRARRLSTLTVASSFW